MTSELKLEQLETELKKARKDGSRVLVEAIEGQIAVVQKKMTGMNNRKAETKDGVLVGINETVYEYITPKIYTNYGNVTTKRAGSITEKKVTAVSTKGNQFAFDRPMYGRPSYHQSTGYFSTAHAAAEACLKDVEYQTNRKQSDIDELQKQLTNLNEYSLDNARELLAKLKG